MNAAEIVTGSLALTGLVAGATGVAALVMKAQSRPFRGEVAPAKGSAARGVAYALTLGMAPWAKESTRRHFLAYARGVLLHAGIFAGLAWLAASPWRAELPEPARLLAATLLAAGAAMALAGFGMRLREPALRAMSTWDDYVSLGLVTLFLLLGAASAAASEFTAPFWATAGIMIGLHPLGQVAPLRVLLLHPDVLRPVVRPPGSASRSEERDAMILSDEKAATVKATLGKLLDRKLLASLEVCVRCGICAETCHYYLADPRPENAPFYRSEQVRRLYRSLFDPVGRRFPWWVGAKRPTEESLASLAEMAFAKCTLCRRCTVNCPSGCDTAQIMRAMRTVAVATGQAPEMLLQLADAALAREEFLEDFKDIYLEQVKALEDDLRQATGDPDARIPVEVQDADVLYVALSGAHTILPAAILFHEAGTNWTLSMFEAYNYGVFLGDASRAKRITERIVREAERLQVKEVVVTDCGHAYTTLRWEAPNWSGKPFPFSVRSLIELTAGWIADGTIVVDPSRNPEPVTYHDSCNLGRNSGLIEEPRAILRAVCQDFREMTPNRENNYCCGGGAGLVAIPEWTETRLKAGRPKAEQIKTTGASLVAASCDNCRIQLGDIVEHYGLDTQVVGLAELVVKALVPRQEKRRQLQPVAAEGGQPPRRLAAVS